MKLHYLKEELCMGTKGDVVCHKAQLIARLAQMIDMSGLSKNSSRLAVARLLMEMFREEEDYSEFCETLKVMREAIKEPAVMMSAKFFPY